MDFIKLLIFSLKKKNKKQNRIIINSNINMTVLLLKKISYKYIYNSKILLK